MTTDAYATNQGDRFDKDLHLSERSQPSFPHYILRVRRTDRYEDTNHIFGIGTQQATKESHPIGKGERGIRFS